MQTEEQATALQQELEGSSGPEIDQVSKSDELVKEEVAQEEDPRDVIKRYLEDENTSKNLRTWVDFLSQKFGKKWFTVQDVSKYVTLSAQSIGELLALLILKGNIHRREYGVEKSPKFKVCVKTEDKIALLLEQKQDLLNQVEVIDREVSRLSQSGQS